MKKKTNNEKKSEKNDPQTEQIFGNAEDTEKYIRVRTDFYFKGHTLTSKGEKIPQLILWKKSTILQDYYHIHKFIDNIPKYISFVNVPDNRETYKEIIEGCYNLYERIRHTPKEGETKNTLQFLKHIFQDKIDIGLDYLTILYKYPTQILPVLCLVSKNNNTGKSTFIKWLGEIFGNNSVILGNKDFESNFNSHWASKLIVSIDESFIEQRVIKEKIKHQSTEDTINLEAKGRDIVKLSWIGKFILVSNNETNFIRTDKEDQRFFVLKVPVIPEDEYNVNFYDNLKNEIPAFLHFLEKRKIVHTRSGRMWFETKLYETEAFKATVRDSRSFVEKAMINYFSEIFDNLDTIQELFNIPKLIAKELKEEVRYYKGSLAAEVERILKIEWNLTPLNKPERFTHIVINNFNTDSIHEEIKVIGRYYTIKKDLITSLKNS